MRAFRAPGLAVAGRQAGRVVRSADSNRAPLRVVVAASRSGEGKTTMALGLVGALRRRGLTVAAAKVGPDYLDTGWHRVASGGEARNLDLWMTGEAGVRTSFEMAARDVDAVVIEGVMGLFDGHRAAEAETSTADVARVLDAPVLLVLDASRSAATLAAVAAGLARFDERVRIAGVVLNRFGEHRERASVERAFERAGLPVLGWVPPAEAVGVTSRHLGLTLAEETAHAEQVVAAAADLVERWVNVDALVEAMRGGCALPFALVPPAPSLGARVRIGVARDAAFAFYYPDNLEALERAGAEVVEFSPLTDAALPERLDGIYLGGGYPELHSARLSANDSMRASISNAAAEGMPIYAECGGMLYLLESLADGEERVWPMTGVVSARAAMTGRLQRVGYVEASLATDCVLGSQGTVVRGHEFRYSACEPAAGDQPAWLVDGRTEGFVSGNVVASYLHLHFGGCPSVAESFVGACRTYSKSHTTISRRNA